MKKRNLLSLLLCCIPFAFFGGVSEEVQKLLAIVSVIVFAANKVLSNPEKYRKKALIFVAINSTLWLTVSEMAINRVKGVSLQLVSFMLILWFICWKLLNSVQRDIDMNEKYIVYCNTISELEGLLDDAEKIKFEYVFYHTDRANMQDLLVEFEGKEIKTLLSLETDELIKLINNFDIAAIENVCKKENLSV